MKKDHILLMTSLFFCGILTTSLLLSPLGAQYPVTANEYDLLIITADEFQTESQRLADHKNSIGMDTMVISFNELIAHDASAMGRDPAEQMKYYIKYALEEYDITYVLLIGGKIGQLDQWYLPVRYVQMDNGWEPHYISDLYFADIYDEENGFSSWDSDNDGVYGEWVEGRIPEDTNIDLYPDVCVGRIPARSEHQLQVMVDKIIQYETTTHQQPWFNTFITIAGDTYLETHNPLWVGYEGEYYAERAIENMTGFTPVRMYLSENGFTGPEDVIEAMEPGCGFIYFVGHGNPRSWGNHPPNDEEFVNGLQNTDMNQLANTGKYTVCVVSGCHNCQFDVGLLDIMHGIREQGLGYFAIPGGHFWRSEWAPESWGWKLMRLPESGSIVTYGASALGHTKEDKTSFAGGINELEVEMFRQYGQLNVNNAGDIIKNAITWYLDEYPVDWDTPVDSILRDTWVDVQVVESYVLLGDPSLKIGGHQSQ